MFKLFVKYFYNVHFANLFIKILPDFQHRTFVAFSKAMISPELNSAFQLIILDILLNCFEYFLVTSCKAGTSQANYQFGYRVHEQLIQFFQLQIYKLILYAYRYASFKYKCW